MHRKADFVEIRGHTAAVRSVNFSRDSKILLTSSDDKTAKVFALPTRKFLCSLVGHSNWVRTSSLSTDTKHAVTGSDDKLVKIWDMNTTQCVHTFHDHDE